MARWRAGRARRAQAPCANDAGDRDFLTSDLNTLAPTFWLLFHHLAAVDLYRTLRILPTELSVDFNSLPTDMMEALATVRPVLVECAAWPQRAQLHRKAI